MREVLLGLVVFGENVRRQNHTLMPNYYWCVKTNGEFDILPFDFLIESKVEVKYFEIIVFNDSGLVENV